MKLSGHSDDHILYYREETMFNKKKIAIITLVFVLFMFFGMSCVRKEPPPRPFIKRECGPGMIWLPGHYGPGGRWIPGHCAYK